MLIIHALNEVYVKVTGYVNLKKYHWSPTSAGTNTF